MSEPVRRLWETALLHFQFLLDPEAIQQRQRRARDIAAQLRSAETVEEKGRLLREKPWSKDIQ